MRFVAALTIALAPLTAFAQEAEAGSPLISMAPMLLIFVVFYFMLIRPQQKKFKEHTALLAGLKKGDEVVTSGGILGKVVEADKDGVTTVEIASGVVVKVTKASISALTGKSAPVAVAKKNSAVKNDNVVLKKDQIANDN